MRRPILYRDESGEPPAWLKAWTEDPLPMDAVIDWMRTRPESVKAVMRRLPPLCVVRGKKPLLCPARGELAILYSICEDGTVTVIRDPEGATRYQCDAGWLEPVAYRCGITPEFVCGIIGAG
jgi:hypothetical protein